MNVRMLSSFMLFLITSAGLAQLPCTPAPVQRLDNGTTTVDSPPCEVPGLLKPDLVELIQIDPALKLDIRYATSNNFVGRPMYAEPRAFMQRPAAEALRRAHAQLQRQGYAIIIHDGYRPWSVTKVFWDVTPQDKKEFVADPARGSRHNRGCAIDLSLCDLATSAPVEMPTPYDDFTTRAYALNPEIKGAARMHRDLLRQAMLAEGFEIEPSEWWHFDYREWRKYPVLNKSFDQVALTH